MKLRLQKLVRTGSTVGTVDDGPRTSESHMQKTKKRLNSIFRTPSMVAETGQSREDGTEMIRPDWLLPACRCFPLVTPVRAGADMRGSEWLMG
jgi:hypothetical protein